MGGKSGGGSVIGSLFGLAAAGALGWAALRKARRSAQAQVQSEFKCRCGQVHGEVCAIPEDGTPLLCYCHSCREVASWVAAKSSDGHCALDAEGGLFVIHFCKDDVQVHAGLDKLKLVVRDGKSTTRRFYTSCCGTLLFVTSENTGVLGIVAEAMDERKEGFGPPRISFSEEAEKRPSTLDKYEQASIQTLLWNVMRFAPAMHRGPRLDFSQQPEYFRKSKKKTN